MIPRLSVIVPIYKVEHFLKKCIDSLISQKYENVEILLVDDGSPDNCPKICDEYALKDDRIRVIHKRNGGLVSARQAGCQAAIGDYILNVDGDDWVKPNYFEVINDIIDKYKPDCICFGYCSVTSKKSQNIPCRMPSGFYNKTRIEKEVFPSLIEDADGKYVSPAICFKAVKRSVYYPCQMAVDTRIKIGEDNACTKPVIFKSCNMYVSSECIYCYNHNPTSMTRGKRIFSWDGPELIGRNFEQQIDMSISDFKSQVYRNIVHNLFNVAISHFYQNSNIWTIRKEIIKGVNTSYYMNAIRHCRYKSLKGKLSQMALKNHWFLPMFIYSRFH